MRIVLGAVLSACELQPADDRFELAQRRNITIKPAGGARTVMRTRSRSAAAPVPA
jgi:hypothetical protein